MRQARRVPLKAKRPKPAMKERLAVARAEVRAYTKALKAIPAPEWGSALDTMEGPARFVQLVAGGGYNILYALDASGQVWKFRHAYDKETKQTSDERWVPVSMERRDK